MLDPTSTRMGTACCAWGGQEPRLRWAFIATVAASIATATAADATCEPTGSCGPRRRTGAGSYHLDVSPVNRTDRNRDEQRHTVKTTRGGHHTFIHPSRPWESGDISHGSQTLDQQRPLYFKQKASYPDLPLQITDQVALEFVFLLEWRRLLQNFRQRLIKGSHRVLESLPVLHPQGVP